MRSINKAISSLLNTSLKITYPFNETAQVYKNDRTPEYDYYSDISILLFGKYKDKMLKLWGPVHTPPTPQSYSEEILTNIAFRRDFLHKISHDFDGKILFTLKNSFIEEEIRTLLKCQAEIDQGVKDINNMTNLAVLLPFGEIAQKLHLNQFRGTNIAETIARVSEFFGYKVRRFSCLRNSEAFHGVLLGFLREKELELEDKEQVRVSFEDLREFLIAKGLVSQREIVAFGTRVIGEVGGDDGLMKLFAKLNTIAMEDMLGCYNAFMALKTEPLTIIDSYNLSRKLSNAIKHFLDKGRVLFSEEDGFYLSVSQKTGEKKVRLIENLGKTPGVLTKEGVFLGFLNEISILHFMEKVVFSTDLQDSAFYETLQKAHGVLYESDRMPIILDFYGHNSIFLEKNASKSPIFFSQFLDEIVDMGIKRAMAMTVAFPSNLTPDNRQAFRRTILGWFRFKDHQTPKENSYILDLDATLDFIFDNPLTKTREHLIEHLKGQEITEAMIKSFKIESIMDRALSVKLLEFPEILERVLSEKNPSTLTRYFEMLGAMSVDYAQKHQGNKVLVHASLMVLGKCLFLLGVI